MRVRILTLPEDSLANVSYQISNERLRIKHCEGIRKRMRMVLRMKLRKFRPCCGTSLQMEVCDKNFAGDCECDGLVHSVTDQGFPKGGFCEGGGGNLNNWGGARTGCNN